MLSRRMGWLGWRDLHPFTIAAAPDTPDNLVLMVKRSGTWADKLFKLASSGDAKEAPQKVWAWIEGPYGEAVSLNLIHALLI